MENLDVVINARAKRAVHHYVEGEFISLLSDGRKLFLSDDFGKRKRRIVSFDDVDFVL